MPNWCANRMYFSAEPAQIAEIKRLASGAVTPFYRRATNEGIQLFLAGSAGLLQTTEDERTFTGTGSPQRRATGRMAGGGGDGKTPPSGKLAGGISVCGGVFPLSERKPQDIAV